MNKVIELKGARYVQGHLKQIREEEGEHEAAHKWI